MKEAILRRLEGHNEKATTAVVEKLYEHGNSPDWIIATLEHVTAIAKDQKRIEDERRIKFFKNLR